MIMFQDDMYRKFREIGDIARNFLVLKVAFDSQVVRQVNDQKAMTVDSVLASLGGILALWLGISVMTSVELVEFCIVIARNWYRSRRSEVKEVNAVNEGIDTDSVELRKNNTNIKGTCFLQEDAFNNWI